MLQDLTGIATVATLPMWWQHGLPEEDGVFDDRSIAGGTVAKTVCVIAYPRISNLDEYQPLKNVPGVRLQWVRSPSEINSLKPSDWIILPGSKNTSGDLAWLRSQGLDAAVAHHAGQGGAVLGICGGLQMLGEALIDLHGVDGNAPGLGLLPLVTVFEAEKTVRHTHTRFAAVMADDSVGDTLAMTANNPWSPLAGVEFAGYEIHHGQTQPHAAMLAAGDLAREILPQGLGWQNPAGNVMGLYLHGLFEDPAALQALFGARLSTPVPTLDSVFDGLADFIERYFEPGALKGLLTLN
jgi:adenosylcobyric acid synthase